MAQVTRPRDGEGNRGQMILLMGVVLAVMFVALALLVNAAIYTDNVATRGGDPAAEALEYQNGVVDSTAGLLDAENPESTGEDDTTAGDIETAIGIEHEHHERYHLRRGAATDTTVESTAEGRLVSETNANGFETWEASASEVRGFVITLDTSNMTVGNETSFYLNIDGTELEVNKTSTDVVEVEGGTEGISCTANADADGDVEFDVTGELLGGDTCEFGFPAFSDGSRIGIKSGENGAGSYELAIRSNEATSTFPSSVTRFVYDVDVALRIDTPELSYERTVRITSETPDV